LKSIKINNKLNRKIVKTMTKKELTEKLGKDFSLQTITRLQQS